MKQIISEKWIKDEKGDYVYEVKSKDGIEFFTPEQKGLKKSVEFFVIFYEKSEVTTRRHENKTKTTWFKQKFTATVKAGNDNIFLLLDQKRFFIKDLEPDHFGFTMLMPLESTENLLIETEDETETTIEDVREILKVTNYAFSDKSEEGFKKEIGA